MIVADSRPAARGRFRRRECLDCNTKWNTMEVNMDDRGIARASASLRHVEGALVKIRASLDQMQRLSACNE